MLRIRGGSLDPGQIGLGLGLVVAVPAAAVLATVHPTAILAAALVLLVVGVTLVRTDIAVLFLVATGPLESLFPDDSAISITKIAGALAFLSFAFYIVRSHRRLIFEPMQAVVLTILGLAMLSATQALDLSSATTTATRYGSFVALYIVVSELEPTASLQRAIAWTLALASTASAILGLQRYLGGLETTATLAYANPNDFAFMLATSLPLMFWLLGGRRRYLPLLMAMIAVVFAAIVLSLSRGTLVGLFAGFLFIAVTDRRRLQIGLLGAVLAASATLFVIHSNPEQFQNALVLKQHVAQENVTTRFEAWSIAGRLATDHPFLGIGPGNFRLRYPEMAGLPPGAEGLTVAHDAYLDIAAEVGIFAAMLFIVYLATSFYRLTIANRKGYGLSGYAQALRISLVIALTCSIFLSEQYFMPFWLIGALATALFVNGERDGPAESVAAA